jgi:hypothetical protein
MELSGLIGKAVQEDMKRITRDFLGKEDYKVKNAAIFLFACSRALAPHDMPFLTLFRWAIFPKRQTNESRPRSGGTYFPSSSLPLFETNNDNTHLSTRLFSQTPLHSSTHPLFPLFVETLLRNSSGGENAGKA